MKIVYDASNSLDAHLVKGVLKTYEIEAYVQGEHLHSGAGELAMTGFVNVTVADDDFVRAKAFIKDWESNQLVNEDWLTEAALASAPQE